MKRILLSALIGVSVVVVIFIFSTSEAAPTQQSYPLICRGSGSLAIGVAPGEQNIGFTFVHGAKPAGVTGQGLAPGECSWADRVVYPTEPDKISQHFEGKVERLEA